MIKHKCNNVIMPKLPEEPDFQYSLMIQLGFWDYDLNDPQYYLVFSKMPFFVVGTQIVYFVAGNEWKCYSALSTGTEWVSVELIPADQDSEVESLGLTSMYIWCGEDIAEYPNTPFYSASKPVEVIAADPPHADFHFEPVYTYSLGSKAKGMTFDIESPDGGELSFAWHKMIMEQVGDKLRKRDGGVVSTDRIFYPPTNSIGSTAYYCCVHNSLNGTVTGAYTDTFIVTVIEAPVKNDGVLIGYVLSLAGVPCGQQIGEMLDKVRKPATISAFSIREETLMPCECNEALITSSIIEPIAKR